MQNPQLSDFNAASTQKGLLPAIKHFDVYQKERRADDPVFSDLDEFDLEGQNVCKLLLGFGIYLAGSDVECIGKPGVYLSPASKEQYFGRIKEALKAKSRDNPVWKDEESWYAPQLDGLKRASMANHLRNPDTFKVDTLPLYTKISDGLVRAGDRAAILRGDENKAKDLAGACSKLLALAKGGAIISEGPLQKRLWLIACAQAVGRPGEIKFTRFDEMSWDPFFEAPDMVWTELKTRLQHSMLAGPTKEDYSFDWYHALGSFFAVEHGATRTEDVAHAKNFMFPSLHKVEDRQVAAKLSKILKDLCGDLFSAKSLRRGTTSELYVNPGVSEAELDARGGWVAESNSRSYKLITPVLTIPALNALNSWSDTRTPKKAPRLEHLGIRAQGALERLMAQLFIIDLPFFKPGGALRPLLRACTAALIMYHFELVRDHGIGNLVAQSLLNAARKAEIERDEPGDVVSVLKGWSQNIRTDFRFRNPDVCVEISPAILSKANSLIESAQMNIVASCDYGHRVCELTAAVEALTKAVADGNERIKKMELIMKNNKKVNSDSVENPSKLVRLGASVDPNEPPRASSAGPSAADVTAIDHENVEVPVGARPKRRLDEKSQGAGPAHDKSPSSKKAKLHGNELSVNGPNPLSLLRHGAEAEAAAGRDITISDLLFRLWEGGLLKGNQSDLGEKQLKNLPENEKQRYVFQLAEYAMTKEEWTKLSDKTLSSNEAKQITGTIGKKCMDLLLDWELQTGLKDKTPDKKKSRTKSNFIGTGIRVGKYKKNQGLQTMQKLAPPKARGLREATKNVWAKLNVNLSRFSPTKK
eukprot:CAMPEP_0184709428 /NCGR_PEP_ID=MMETSP0314-20130426/580_1 /TAXON_ID=38298 /ORGANISM="Rhodella maculata, Strain CCMP 736" /LENGTH=814 /DNA_ID=CAMNT_0027171133 /DNA_START=237 /DNA_END=2681 /DNA_ORIENTATION=-